MTEIGFNVYDADKDAILYQSLHDLLNGIGDDCADCEAQRFRQLVLFDGVEPDIVIT